jgi:hypothetical protein
VDYVATTDFALLDELPRPRVSIFTNRAVDGTHWIGVSAADQASGRATGGELLTFGETKLTTLAEQAREKFAAAHGRMPVYLFQDSPPLSDDQLQIREARLIELAKAGAKLHDSLFDSNDNLTPEQLDALDARLGKLSPGDIVTVARCRGESTTLPWALLYDRHLDPRSGVPLRLCSVFAKALREHNQRASQSAPPASGAAGGAASSTSPPDSLADVLRDPAMCQTSPECRLLSEAERAVTVCPFAFWGFRLQIEQPLQQVPPTDPARLPQAVPDASFAQSSFVRRSRDEKLRLAIAAYPFDDATTHHAAIKGLGGPTVLEVRYTDTREDVLQLLYSSGFHVYYFYCHGVTQNDTFSLKLGPKGAPGFISAAELERKRIPWRQEPKPLVILNGCETMAVVPEKIHDFLYKLKNAGAAGVIGSEIPIDTRLARPFGEGLLQRLLGGLSVGEAFLEARLLLLRQGNPLGLVYSYYSPATLHLHDPDGCRWCDKHRPSDGPVTAPGAPASNLPVPTAAGPAAG